MANFWDKAGNYLKESAWINPLKTYEKISGKKAEDLDPTTPAAVNVAPIEKEQAASNKLIEELKKQQGAYIGRKAPQLAAPMQLARGDVKNVAYTDAVAGTTDVAQAEAASRGSLLDALRLQQQAAEGNAPSAAEMQMQSGQNAAIQAQMAMARSGRGGYNPAAQRAAMQQGAQMQQENILKQSALRAQEMQQARAGMTEAAGALSNRDIQQAQIQQQANIANLDAGTKVAIANADKQLAAQLANQGVDLEVLKANATLGNQTAIANLQAQLQQAGMDDAMVQAYLNAVVGLQTGMGGMAQGITAAQQAAILAAQANKTALQGKVLEAGGEILSSYSTQGGAGKTGGASPGGKTDISRNI